MSTLLGMFAKHWMPGRVKTRLAADIGELRAAEVHRLFVQTLLSRFGMVADERILVFDPPESEQEFLRIAAPLWQILPQSAGDLGQRMAAFFAAGLARSERVVLIGSDSPDLPREYVALAFEALEEGDVVLGPACDGGYYLVGAARSVPPIFTGLKWSTADLWSQTIQRLEESGCRWRSLPQWYDVDTAEDFIRLRLGLLERRQSDVCLGTLADRLTAFVASPHPQLAMHDVLIIGGGVIGLSLAWELARRGKSVQVIDQGEPGREASWAGAGILPPAGRRAGQHPYEQLAALAAELHPQWATELREATGIDNGYRRCGGLYLARSPGEAAALAAWTENLRAEGIEVERITAERLLEVEPGLDEAGQGGLLVQAARGSTDAVPGTKYPVLSTRIAYAVPSEAQIRNPWHLQALTTACLLARVSIRTHAAAGEVVMADREIAEIKTPAGALRARQYCFTAGAWTGPLLARLGIATGIVPIRGQMVLFRCATPPVKHIINVGSRYLVPRDDGRLLTGSTEEEAGFDKRTTDEAIAELTAFARDIIPALKEAEIERTWAGLRPGSFDGLPYLGRLPGLTNAFVASGHYRSGLFLSPATAVVMAQAICSEATQVDLSPFRVGR